MMASDQHRKAEPPKHGRCGEGSLWEWSREARVAGAEGAGTALLVLLSCVAPTPAPLAALAAGAVVGMLVQCFDHISGAMFNPTVTLAALVWGRVSARRALSMTCAQLAGACLGAAALHALAPPRAPSALGLTSPAPGYSVYKAVLVEGVAGGCLALANCAAWDPRNAGLRDSWPLRIGTCVTALSLVSGELTGASMNPARSFGPALLAADFTAHWVYWVGPLGGSLVCTALYSAAWRPRPAPGRTPAAAARV